MDTKLEELLEEIEQSSLTSRQVRPFNQPDLIAISSLDRTGEDPNANGFSSFSVNLPLPALDVKSLQLLQTNIPQANANIPNTACVFWYYRLSEYSGRIPSLDNLYYVRLLPTTYKQEYIYNPSQYGYNQTFNNYNAVATQLAKSCVTDLVVNNIDALNQFDDGNFPTNTYVPFLSNDISITYDTASNKFQMTGLNTKVAYLLYNANTLYAVGDVITNADRNTAYVNLLGSRGVSRTDTTFPAWVSGTNYEVGNIITFNNIVYKLTTNGETVNQNPAIQTPAFYTRLGRALAVSSYTAWVSGTNYAIGDAVSYEGVVYVLYADGETVTTNPARQPTKWVSQPTQITPSSVWTVKNNIEIVGTWASALIYPVGSIVEFEGNLYSSANGDPSSFSANPTDTNYWDVFTPPPNWYRYLITGYNDPNVRKMQGDLFNVEWNENRTYNENAVVYYNELPFIALKTNRGVSPIIPIQLWNNFTVYNPNDVVVYQDDGKIYITGTINSNRAPPSYSTYWTQLSSVSSNPPLSVWNSTTIYDAYDVVQYQGLMYQSTIFGDNVGNVPSGNVGWILRNYVDWTTGASYNTGRVVLYSNNLFQSSVDNNTRTPTSTGSGWNILGSPITEWWYSETYSIGTSVIYGGRVYISLVNSNTSREPPSHAQYWKITDAIVGAWGLADAPLRTGLYGLTSRYDMTEFIGNTGLLENFPYGVGGQPFNPNPRRLLNSILGFTWNGTFVPSQFADIQPYTTAVLTTRQQPLLYNRLRPIPDYIVILTPSPPPLGVELGQDQSATISLTYTADGYANLVYSSIISIYTDVVKSSSVDTQGTTKLLAVTSMNCGNLGIAFWSNYIENPLLKVQGDIYSIYIEFRDEFGEPFFLTNNAVATLTFKLIY